MDKPLCLVTGACGFMGTHMVELLCAEGFAVRATDLPGAIARDDRDRGLFPSIVRGLGVELVGADLTDAAAVRPLADGVGLVFHIAGLFRYSAGWKALERVNVGGTRHLLEATTATGELERFIFWGAGGVYGVPRPEELPLREDGPTRPPNDYQRSKHLAEKLVMDVCGSLGIPHAVLRPTTVYGPRAVYGGGTFITGMAGLNPALIPTSCTGRVPMVHVRDVVRAALHLATCDGEVEGAYNVNDDSTFTQVEVMRFFAQLMGNVFIKLPPVPVTPVIRGVATVAGLVERLSRDVLKRPSPVEADMLAMSIGDYVYDNTKLKRTGFAFDYPDPRPGIRDTVEWYRQNGWM